LTRAGNARAYGHHQETPLLTTLVCSSCHSALAAETPHCPYCGPEGPALVLRDEHELWADEQPDADVPGRLARALGAHYQVTRFLGRGGFAEVYEVRDTDLQRRLAVKVMRPDIAWTGGALSRFKQEARAIARLNHPNTVPIHFVGEGEGLVFYAMPYVEGQSLGEILRLEGALDAERTTAIVVPVLEALDYAHRHGLVHRDIKPDNILIESGTGRPLLVDFGIAKSLDGENVHQTQSGFVVGTPLYMSPEQALGQPNVDARADIYAMGAVLFQMLTGAPPFQGATSQEIVSKHLTEPVPEPAARDVRIPQWLSDVILRCMAKRPGERYQSAAEVLAALQQAPPGAGADTAARVAAQLGREAPTIEMERAPPARRGRWAWVAAVALLAAALALAWRGRSGASIVVRNRLIEPVTVSYGGGEHLLSPGDSVRMPLPHGAVLDAHWRALRPRSTAGRELGLTLEGAVRDSAPRGVIRRDINVATLGRPIVAPVVTNLTAAPLRVVFRDARGVAVDCDCMVPPGVSSSIGYRDASHRSAVEFPDDAGRPARIVGRAARADRATGAVPIRLTPADFAPQRINPERPRAPVTVTLPLPRTELITDTVPLPRPDTTLPRAEPERRPPPLQTDPLRGTVTNH
jgi:aminoglycoside phosphotransferase (APT) family kinase protein